MNDFDFQGSESPAGMEQAVEAVTQPNPCWNSIGVYGNTSCPELEKLGHCRNCATFSAAGLKLLESPLPANYQAEWTRHFALRKKEFETSDASALVFRLQEEWYAMPTRVFQEVSEKRAIHSLPHRRRGSLLGLANVRGELVICVSLGHVLGMSGLPAPEVVRRSYDRLLVVQWRGSRFAFPVDEVPGTHRLRLPELKSPPVTVARSAHTFTQGMFQWEGRAVGLLHPDLLLETINQNLA